MSTHAEVNMNALWRKSFFCKPYTGDRADALRFKDEFEEAAALKNADSDYTMQESCSKTSSRGST